MKRIFSLLICIFFCTAISLPMMAMKVWAYSPETDFQFNSATHTITRYLGSSSVVDIPPTIGGVSVEHIGSSAFLMSSLITSVTIPNSVTSIGDDTFFNCVSLTSVTIPNSLVSIGNSAFVNCNALTSITLPNSLLSIGNRAFVNCDAFTSITIPDSVLSIGSDAFGSCHFLASVTLPKHITSIEDYTFVDCYSLTSITIPQGVTSMKDYAFNGCSHLTTATFTGNAPTTWGAHVFDGTAPTFTIYYYAEKTGTGFSTPTFHGYNSVPLYRVMIAPTSGGSVTASTSRTTASTVVNLTVTPDTNRFVDSLYYTDTSGKHMITGNSFIMPASEVTIHAVFTWLPIINLFFALSYIFLFIIAGTLLWLGFRE